MPTLLIFFGKWLDGRVIFFQTLTSIGSADLEKLGERQKIKKTDTQSTTLEGDVFLL